jgi:Zn-dependent protease/predicted transcriptional regulator
LLFGVTAFVYLGQTVPEASTESAGLVAALAGVAMVGCVFLHEAGHVVIALRRGLAVRSIRLYMFGGYSVIDGVPTPRTEFLVSIAGPAASVLIGLVMMITPYLVGTDNLVGATLWALGLANMAIGVFNLLPGFPLDGGRIVRSILSRGGRDRVKATQIVTTIGRVIGFASMGVGALLLSARQTTGLFWLVVGWFLATTAVSAGRREQLSAAFDGMTIADVMRATPDAVSGNATISDVLDLYAIGPRLRSLPVEMTGRVVGVIGQDEIDSISPSRWPSIRVRALMSRIGPADVVEADAPLESLLLRPAGASGRAIVVRDGMVVGIVDGQALASVLSS